MKAMPNDFQPDVPDIFDYIRGLERRIRALEQGNDEGFTVGAGASLFVGRPAGGAAFESDVTGVTKINPTTGAIPVIEAGSYGAKYPFISYPWRSVTPVVMPVTSAVVWNDLFEFRGAKFNDYLLVRWFYKADADIALTSVDFRVVDRNASDTPLKDVNGNTQIKNTGVNISAYTNMTFAKSLYTGDSSVGTFQHYVLQGKLAAGIGPASVTFDRATGALQ